MKNGLLKELLQLTSPFSNSAPLMYSLDLEVVDLQRRKGGKGFISRTSLKLFKGGSKIEEAEERGSWRRT